MSDSHILTIIIAAVLGILALFNWIDACVIQGEFHTLRGAAVTRGYAEWKVNPLNGVTSWQWKEAAP